MDGRQKEEEEHLKKEEEEEVGDIIRTNNLNLANLPE